MDHTKPTIFNQRNYPIPDSSTVPREDAVLGRGTTTKTVMSLLQTTTIIHGSSLQLEHLAKPVIEAEAIYYMADLRSSVTGEASGFA